MTVEFLEPAVIEYEDAVDYYDLQSPGLGNKFVKEVDNTINLIKKYPDSFAILNYDLRRATVNLFPYSIIYKVNKNKIIVVAIAHQHRRPRYWLSRNG